MDKLKAIKSLFRHLLRRKPRPLISLERPTEQEQILIEELRSTFKRLALSASLTPDVEDEWIKYEKRLHYLVLNDDPRAFLRWDIISRNMFVADADYIKQELESLKQEQQWQNRWRAAIKESSIGCPTPYSLYTESSGNLIHHAYHLSQFEKVLGKTVDTLDMVWEFGGGYGSMCRLFYNLGFKGLYIIFDLPRVSALQRFFLKSLNIPIVSLDDAARGKRGVLLSSELDQLKSLLSDMRAIDIGERAFVATWSVSETPIALRKIVLELARDFDCYLIAYQDRFSDVNNIDFFETWRATIEGYWQTGLIAHVPGDNRYLFGVREKNKRAEDVVVNSL
ncbi:MAG: hypothetical protein DMF68_10800 [Acidobacteria bacterium]|nr:MAG: hypothetical protein DMF68_10800 [Acidobacteriota bacterium]